MVVLDSPTLRPIPVGLSPAVAWLAGTNYFSDFRSVGRILRAGEGGWMVVDVRQIGRPVQISLEGHPHRPGDTVWDHFCNRLPWNTRKFFAGGASEPR